MSLKTEILKIKGDWIEVASDCRSTVGKPPLNHEPSVDFKKKILIAEHSPIRDISVKWTWRGIKSLVATQEEIFLSPGDVDYHLRMIEIKTGLNPRVFVDLVKLLFLCGEGNMFELGALV